MTGVADGAKTADPDSSRKAKGEKVNANELKNHLRETMRGDIGQHLREVHGLTEVPKTKQAQAKLHAEQDHGNVAATEDFDSKRDAAVLAGVTRPKSETAKPAPKPIPARRTAPKAPAAKAPAKPAKRTPAKAAAKAPAPKPAPASKAPAPKAESNGHATSREVNQTVARRLAALAAEAFGSETPEVKAKVAYWLHSLPTGGEGGSWNRWWPESLPRPETADWRKPE